MNVGLSVLDIRHPDLHTTVQRVRFWSITTAITLNVIAHYGERVPQLDRIDIVGALLALVASVPLAVLYVALAGLLHAISEGCHTDDDDCARLTTELATARADATERTREIASLRDTLAKLRDTHAQEIATLRAHTHDHTHQLAQEIAHLQATLANERERLAPLEAQARAAEQHTRDELAQVRERHHEELREARAVATRAEREAQRLNRELAALRAELAARSDRSRAALMREAQQLQAEHGWGSSEIARHLGWPESTVRGWLPARTSAAD
jgi:hypothetical protein